MSLVARGAAITLASRLAAVALGLAITVDTACMGIEAHGQFALITAIDAVLIAQFSGIGLVQARRASNSADHADLTHTNRPPRKPGWFSTSGQARNAWVGAVGHRGELADVSTPGDRRFDLCCGIAGG